MPPSNNIYDNLLYLLGGGQQQADYNLQALQLAQAMEAIRQNLGFQLLDYVTQTQQNPFSIVPALQQYGAAGGSTLAPAEAFARTGGLGTPSPYGPIAQRLIEGLATFTGGAPINPGTGQPFTPQELAYIRIVLNQKGQQPTGLVDPNTGFESYAPPTATTGQSTAAQPPTGLQGEAAGSAAGSPQAARPQTQAFAGEIRRIREGGARRRAGRYLQGSPLGIRGQ